MLPPGLSFNAISQKARQAARNGKSVRSYWDWEDMLAANAKGYFPYTPSTNLLQGLKSPSSFCMRKASTPSSIGTNAPLRRHVVPCSIGVSRSSAAIRPSTHVADSGSATRTDIPPTGCARQFGALRHFAWKWPRTIGRHRLSHWPSRGFQRCSRWQERYRASRWACGFAGYHTGPGASTRRSSTWLGTARLSPLDYGQLLIFKPVFCIPARIHLSELLVYF